MCLVGALLLAGISATDVALKEKADRFRDALADRHVSPEGMVLYRVDLATLEEDLDRGRYPDLADTPTFTGLWAATACVRVDVETDPARRRRAEADADRAMKGLVFLMDVTGTRGLLARGARRNGPWNEGTGKKWLPGGPGYEDYAFRGDVSVDQYANGLLPAAWECRHDDRKRSRRLVIDFATHLLENDLRIIDADGVRTKYGNLGPSSGYGFNSIAQLTAYATFALAARFDPDDARWSERRDQLRDRLRMVARSSTTNVRILGVTNHSNDLMAWNLYRVLIPLARETNDPALPDLRYGMHRAWLRVREDENPYFTAVFCSVEPSSCDRKALANARDTLARFPLEKRKLTPDSALEDLPRRWIPDRKGRRQARSVVPIEIRPPSSLEWKSSPYRVTGTTNETIEYTGVDFLAAYWLLRQIGAEEARASSGEQ